MSLRKKIILIMGLSIALLSFSVTARAITRGYQTSDALLKPGMVAALSADSTPENVIVERASKETAARIIGITVNPNDSSVVVGNENSTIYVESTGEVPALVTGLNGEVRKDDALTISPLKGLLMKADEDSVPVAVALEDFSSAPEVKATVEDGSEVSVKSLQVTFGLHPSQGNSVPSDDPSVLRRFGSTLVRRDVTDLQVIIAFCIFFIMLATEGSIIYAGISSGITAIGRNPLAKDLVRHELFRMVFIAFGVLVVGLVTIYIVLLV